MLYTRIILHLIAIKNILKIKYEKSVMLWGDAVKIMKNTTKTSLTLTKEYITGTHRYSLILYIKNKEAIKQ